MSLLSRPNAPAHQHRTPRRWRRRTLISVAVLAGVVVVVAASAYGYLDWRLGQVKRIAVPGLTPQPASGPAPTGGAAAGSTGDALTVLIVGSDSRSGLNVATETADQSATHPVSGQRADTILLVRLDPHAHQARILSIPRDLWVPIQGHGGYAGTHQKINAGFATGPGDLVETVQDDLGIPINHYVEINFTAFQKITDAVGGIKQYFPTPARDTTSLLSIPAAGCYTLDGTQALEYVRSRDYQYELGSTWHFEAASDLARIDRQQQFLENLLAKAARIGLDNPFKLNATIGAITNNLTVDNGFSTKLMRQLVSTLRSINPTQIPSATYPTLAVNDDPDAFGQDVLLSEPQLDRAAVTTFLTGSPGPTSQPVTTPAAPATTTTAPATEDSPPTDSPAPHPPPLPPLRPVPEASSRAGGDAYG